MTSAYLSTKEILIHGARAFVSKASLWVQLALLNTIFLTVIELGPRLIEFLEIDNPYTAILIFFTWSITLLLAIIKINLVTTKAALDTAYERNSSLKELSKTPYFWSFVTASVLWSLSLSLGFLLLIIPGVILSLKFKFFPQAIVEGHTAVGSIKKSSQLTYGFKWTLLLYSLTMFMILVTLSCLVGALIIGTLCLVSFSYHISETSLLIIIKSLIFFSKNLWDIFFILTDSYFYRWLCKKAS